MQLQIYIYLIILIILIILFNYTIKEKFETSNESTQNIYATFVKQTISPKNINKSIFFDENNTININNVLNINNDFKFANIDLRQYFTGCILISMDPEKASVENGGNKKIFQQGLYVLNNSSNTPNDINFEQSFDDKTDILIVFPGFGIYAWENSLFTNEGVINSGDLGQYIKIENYGKNPIKVKLKDGSVITSELKSNIIPSTIDVIPTSKLNFTDSNSYKITHSQNFTDLSNKISALNVYLLKMTNWSKHIVPTS